MPGGLTDDSQIKILVCHVLDSLELPISHDSLLEALSAQGYANYFECADAISSLLDSGHITANERGGYRLSATGRETAKLLCNDVAATVRERVVNRAVALARRENNKQISETSITQQPGGWKLRCALCDRGAELYALEALFPTKTDAQNARERYYDNAEELMRMTLEILTGEQF